MRRVSSIGIRVAGGYVWYIGYSPESTSLGGYDLVGERMGLASLARTAASESGKFRLFARSLITYSTRPPIP